MTSMTMSAACLMGVVGVATAVTGFVISVSWWVDRLYEAKSVSRSNGTRVPKRLPVAN